MFSKTKLKFDEGELVTCSRQSRRLNSKTVRRIIAISTIVLILILISIIYHGLVLEKIDRLKNIVTLEENHQKHILQQSGDAEHHVEGNIILVRDTRIITGQPFEFDNIENNEILDDDDKTLEIQHGKLAHFKHQQYKQDGEEDHHQHQHHHHHHQHHPLNRKPREIGVIEDTSIKMNSNDELGHVGDALDPLALQSHVNFEWLYSKIRSKRARYALSRLEKEYVRCKKQSVHNTDCMVAFVKMYKLAKDISAKMEKMKEIFKDSEDILEEHSMSYTDSVESEDEDEHEDLKKGYTTSRKPTYGYGDDFETVNTRTTTSSGPTKNRLPITFETTTVAGILNASYSTISIMETTMPWETSTQQVTHEENASWMPSNESKSSTESLTVEPIKISWIMDGNADFDESTTSAAPVEVTSTTMPTTTEDLSTTEQSTTTQESVEVSSIDSTHSVTELAIKTSTGTQITTGTLPNVVDEDVTWILDDMPQEENEDEIHLKSDSLKSNTTLNISTEPITQTITTTTTASESDNGMDRKQNIQWIIDGNDEIESDLSTTQFPKESTTLSTITTTTITTTTTAPTTETIMPENTTAMLSDDEKQHRANIQWIVDGNDDIESESSTTESSVDTTRSESIDESQQNVTITTPEIITSSVTDNLEPITYSWIIDRDDVSVVENSTTKEQQTTLRDEMKETDLLNSTTTTPTTVSVSATDEMLTTQAETETYESTTTAKTNVGGSVSKIFEKLKDEITSIFRDRKVSNDTHLLDYPSSLENLLDSFERQGDLKPLKVNKDKDSNGSRDDISNSTPETSIFSQEELIDTFGHEIKEMKTLNFGPKLNPSNSRIHSPGDTQLMTICERLSQRMRNKESVNSESNMTDPLLRSPFSGRASAGFPVTGETMKATAQFMFNPSFSMPSIPVCFYLTPASFRMANPWTPPYFGMANYFGGSGASGGFMTPTMSHNGLFLMPQSFGTTGNFPTHTTNAGVGVGLASNAGGSNIPNIFTKNANIQGKQGSPQQQPQQQKQQFYCTYMQGHQSPALGSIHPVNDYNFQHANLKMRTGPNNSNSFDVIYASYADLPVHLERKENFKCDLPGQVACYSGHQCIREDAWCDNTVDCEDSSDEVACTCRDRLLPERICDGYADCLKGEDEVGCFGCERFMFSCYDNQEEYERFNRSTISMCYSVLEKCDGFRNCLNGKDELECNVLIDDLTNHLTHSVSTPSGVLYHNYRGEWYPVCSNAQKWAENACHSEGGQSGVPQVEFREVALPGPFIEPALVGSAHFPQTCHKTSSGDVTAVNHVSYVNCASSKCGMRKKTVATSMRPKSKRATDENDNLRIVGGRQSKPLQWPFVVAIYRNGNFHCGGTVYNERWVISAAHCVLNYQKYHYEIRAGLLRRSSYSYSTQIQPVSHVIVHQNYERLTMRNDLSLLRLSEPLKFNRWVKPICLPAAGRTRLGDNWLYGPDENTLCTAVGWGAVREKGPSSDTLKEVVLPIRSGCKDKEDQEAEDICAGDSDGGRDACQGDSGGPLFCQSVNNSDEWYLAGVVSHGNGCGRAGEFGVYTRVALYVDWILNSLNQDELPEKQPLQLCPGHVCVWGGKRCMPQKKRCNRVVDCLGGEDEVGCVYNFIPDVGSARNSTTTTTESDYYLENVESTTVKNDAKYREDPGIEQQPPTADELKSQQEDSTLTTENVITSEIIENSEIPSDTENPLTEIDDSFSTEGVQMGLSTQATLASSTVTLENTPFTEETTESILVDSSTEKTLVVEESFTTEDVNIDFESSSSSPTTVTTTVTVPTPEEDLQNLMEVTLKAFTEDLSTTTSVSTSTEMISEPHEDEISTTTAAAIATTSTAATTIFAPPTRRIRFTTLSLVTTRSIDETMKVKSTTPMPIELNRKNQTITQKPNKFVCKKILQIIEFGLRCDRTIDCEDGTDEEDCSCRDLLKGSLSILICDGKTDCEDLTDEDDCGDCQPNEFFCALSKTCVPAEKRCDDVIDCKFNEDEQDCFALTNGKEVRLDENKRPSLNPSGVFSRNTKGIWRVVCAEEMGFSVNGAKAADGVCTMMGFRTVRYYNTTAFEHHNHITPVEPEIIKRPRLKSHLIHITNDNRHFASDEQLFPIDVKNKLRSERIETSNHKCLGLYVECLPKFNKMEPLKTLSAGNKTQPIKDQNEIIQELKPSIKTYFRPNVYVKPELPIEALKTNDQNIGKLNKTQPALMVNNTLHEALEELHWPWLTDVYVNGRLWCAGILVESHWILVHETCHFGVRLETDYVAALFGGGKTKNLPHASPSEQIRRIDCLKSIPETDVILYHLEKPIQFSHNILPTFLPNLTTYNDVENHECIAILQDEKFGRIKTVPILEQIDDLLCRGSDMTCYRLKENRPPPQHLIDMPNDDRSKTSSYRSLTQFSTCSQFGSKTHTARGFIDPIDQGILVCREKKGGWFPTALFSYNNTDCSSFKQPFGVRSLENSYQIIHQMIDEPKCSVAYSKPKCQTFQCPLGKCLEQEQICDGKQDCHNGSDEDFEMCSRLKNGCKPSEMKCRTSQKCVPKTKFCDHVPDCEDLTDEPTICSCFTYLKATNPDKICDGVRNCWDKSDESPVLCKCKPNLFSCGISTNECIPNDFVCDGERDCPNGEDERYCFGIEQPLININATTDQIKRIHADPVKPPRYGQVIEQSYGLWHTKCFPRNTPPNDETVRSICKKLGYSPYRQPSYRLIDGATDDIVKTTIPEPDQRGRTFSRDSLTSYYRPPTKAVVANRFSSLHVNSELTLFLKPSRPIAELVRWNSTDSSNCYKLEIRCY